MELIPKGQQVEAVEFLDAWLVSKDQCAALQGYAGTGKTWLMGYWLEQVIARNPKWRIIVMAPTNKALDVLRSKCAHLKVSFMTIDSFLGNKIRKNDDGETEKSRGKGQESPDLIVCDEASMVKAEYDRDLRGRRVKTLYVGDPAQLPPINEDISSTFNVPRKFLMTEIVRYQGAIIETATFLRERIESGKAFLLGDLMDFRDEARQLSFIRMEDLHPWALKAVAKGMDARIVAFTNMDVNRHNAIMHSALFPNDALFGVGERIVVNETFELPGTGRTDGERDETEMLYNGQMLTVTHCERADDVAGVVIYNVGVRLDSSDVQVLEVDGVPVAPTCDYVVQVPLNEDHMKAVHKDLTNAIWAARRANEHAEVKRLIDLRKPLNKLAPLRHSYSCTVHKSQGSTYDIAFADWSSIYQSRDRARMMYVATTRPSKFLVLAAK